MNKTITERIARQLNEIRAGEYAFLLSEIEAALEPVADAYLDGLVKRRVTRKWIGQLVKKHLRNPQPAPVDPMDAADAEILAEDHRCPDDSAPWGDETPETPDEGPTA